MKKFISMVMAAAMVVSLVPATAFAANSATFKVVGDLEYTEEAAEVAKDTEVIAGPELQIKLTDLDSKVATGDDFEIELDFANAEFSADIAAGTTVTDLKGNASVTVKEAVEAGDDSIELVVVEATGHEFLQEDDVIALKLEDLGLVITKDNAGTEATVTVSGDFGDSDELVFAAVKEEGVTVTLKDTADVAEEEVTELKKDLKIEADVDTFVAGQEIELKLSKGFEWDAVTMPANVSLVEKDENVLTVKVDVAMDTIVFEADTTKIEAVSAKEGDVATITVKAKDNVAGAFKATAEAVDAAVVVGDVVTISVDEEEDVPVIYSGVNVNNDGITDDSDHKALAVTLEESVAGAFDYKKSFTLTLSEGVFVTDVDVKSEEISGFAASDAAIEAAFAAAYEKGEHETFEFKRKAFGESDKPFEFDVTFELIAVPGFVGDVTLTLGGDAFENEAEVVIATFVSPYTVEAQQNDLIIDYRNTVVPTNIVITEAEAGLWADNNAATAMSFEFEVDHMTFEDDATFTVNEDESDMEVKDTDELSFYVDVESDDEAGVVTISDIALYMSRSLPAGAYDLEMGTSAGYMMMTTDNLYTTENGGAYTVADYADWDVDKDGYWVGEKAVVKEAFINVITAGRDQDDASFTKKVVVPVGESYIIAGEETVALDVPAYINAAGYTMLPVRAVATALGIDNNNVLWSQAAKQVTILYGQRIITMTVGQSVIYVNGSAIPASAAVEVVDGRAFLGLRDLANALGVTDIAYDAATKTATLN